MRLPGVEEEVREELEKVFKGNCFAILATESEDVFHPAGVRPVNPYEDDYQVGVEEEREKEEEKEAGEAVRARAWRPDAVPSEREVEKRNNLDHAVFRSWCPHCAKGESGGVGRAREESAQRGRGADCGVGLHAHALRAGEGEGGEGHADHRGEGHRL